jgi:hypothetical protein
MLASHSSPRRVVTELLLDAAGRRRSPARMPGFRAGRPPRNTACVTPPTHQPWRRSSPSCASPAIGAPRASTARRRAVNLAIDRAHAHRDGARHPSVRGAVREACCPTPRLPSARGVVLASLRPVGRLSALPLIVRCGIANCGAATFSSPCSERVGRVGQSAPRWTLGQSCCEVAGPCAARRRLQLAVGR